MNTFWPQPLPSGAPRLPFPYRAEAEVVSASLAALQGRLDWTSVMAMARPWVQGARATPAPFWAMESLLREYPISKPEGLALMRLAEALLRVPDVETAIALTADQLGRADFDASSTEGPHKMLASLSASAIGLSKRFLPDAAGEGGLLQRLGARTVVAATVRAIQLLGHQFVYARTIGDAVQQAQGLGTVRFSFDMLGEGARTSAAATEYLAAYQSAIEVIARGRRPATGMAGPQGRDEISVKLSALYPRFEDAQRGRVMAELLPRLWTLVQAAAQADINLAIDAEECDRLELSLDLQEALAARVAAEHPQWGGLGLALQTYQTRALELVDEVAAMARRHRTKFVVRLVKGAYWDGEVKRAQEGGLPGYPVFTHKRHTDICYLASAARLIGHHDVLYPQFASHNAGTIAAIVQMARAAGAAFELQRLHGMGEGVHREVLKDKSIVCRVYAPVGEHRDLLAYLVRRLLENGANSSFVHQLADESVGMDELLVSPLRLDPLSSLPLPPDLYGPSRRNSLGLDLTVPAMRAPLLAALGSVNVPALTEATPAQAAAAVARAVAAAPAWSRTPVAHRAAILRSAADALETDLPRFCALLVREAFKTWGDTVAEVREAVDFLRYYANEAERIMRPVALPGPTGETNELRLTARGAWVAISPWNFPLAIFVGQVAAALAAGNTVLAKPAEQTPLVAALAVGMLHSAGIPTNVRCV